MRAEVVCGRCHTVIRQKAVQPVGETRTYICPQCGAAVTVRIESQPMKHAIRRPKRTDG